eukprot:UN20601
MQYTQGATYHELGATADGGEAITITGTVDPNVPGTYTITYTATDEAGNVGTATRVVTFVATTTTTPVITDPCECPEGYGWSKKAGGCKEGSTTSCDECKTMAHCETGSCHAHGCYGYMPHFTCQCTPACDEYGNCCSDQHACNTCQEELYCSEDIPCSTFCHADSVCPCTCGHIPTTTPTTSPSMPPTQTECDMSMEEPFCGTIPCEDICDPNACPCTCAEDPLSYSESEISTVVNADEMARLNSFVMGDEESFSELMDVASDSVTYGLAIIGFLVAAYMLIKTLFFKKNRDGFMPIGKIKIENYDSTSAELPQC